MAGYVNPAAVQLNGSGLVTRSGVVSFMEQFASAESKKAYDDWANHPVTKLVRKVVQDLAISGPSYGVGTDSLPVHHGMTVAFGIVQQLLDDPSLVFPAVFTGVTGGTAAKRMPEETFETAPDAQ